MDQFAAHLDRGWDLVARGDFAGALISAQKSLELDGQSPEAHNLIGYIFAAESRADEALEHYKLALEIDDTFVEAMLNAAEVLIYPLADFPAAIAMIDDALELVEVDDEIADAQLLKFDALLHAGNRDEAARLVKLLPEGPFENPSLEFLIGRAKFEVGLADDAAPHIKKAIERDPHNGEAHYYLGLILDQQKKPRDATVAFLHSRELDAHLAPVAWALAPEQFEKRVEAALHALTTEMRKALDDALVVVSELPGPEVVADGIDPRAPVLVEELSAEGEPPRAGRLFVYQRNIERITPGVDELEADMARAIEMELVQVFPALSTHAKFPAPSLDAPAKRHTHGDSSE